MRASGFSLLPERPVHLAGAALLAFGVALIDYLTGWEIRIYPLYFFPIALAALLAGSGAALAIAILCTALWVVSNAIGAASSSPAWIWVLNTAAQASAFLLVATLVSRLHSSLSREKELARTDPLTGLLNTRAFLERAPALIGLCQRESRPVALAFIDLDNFKDVNDTQGHPRGDEVLRIAGQVMTSTAREADLVGRLGGDEFAILFPGALASGAEEALERLRISLEAAMRSEGCEVTASIGAVAYGEAPGNLEEMIRAADELMYSVKSSGKNRVRILTVAPEGEMGALRAVREG